MNTRIETLDEWARRNIKGMIRYETRVQDNEKYVSLHGAIDDIPYTMLNILCNRYVLDTIQLRAMEYGIWQGEISTAKDRPGTLLINAWDRHIDAGDLKLREARIPDAMNSISVFRLPYVPLNMYAVVIIGG